MNGLSFNWGPEVHVAHKAVMTACAACRRPKRFFCSDCSSDEDERRWRRLEPSTMDAELVARLTRSSCSDTSVVLWALPRVLEAAFLHHDQFVQWDAARFVARAWPLPPSIDLAVTEFLGTMLDELLDTEPPTERRQWPDAAPGHVLRFATEARLQLTAIVARWTNRRSTRATTHLAQHLLWQPGLFDLPTARRHLLHALERAPQDPQSAVWREALCATGG